MQPLEQQYYRPKMHEVLGCMPPCQRMSSGIEHRVGLGDALQPESVRPASHARRVFLSAQELQHPAFLRPDATMPTRQGTISSPTKADRRPSACGASSPLLPPGPEFTTTRRSRRFPRFITVSSPGWTRFLPRPLDLFARRIDSCRTFGCRRNGPAPAQGTSFAQLGRLRLYDSRRCPLRPARSRHLLRWTTSPSLSRVHQRGLETCRAPSTARTRTAQRRQNRGWVGPARPALVAAISGELALPCW